MSLALSLFPDLDGFDSLIAESETVLSLYAAVLAILLCFIVVGECIERRRRSPVEKLLRKRAR